MKKIVVYILALCFIFPLFTSCTDYLDKEPDDMLTQTMVFNDKKRVEEWLAAIYNKAIPMMFDWNQGHTFQNLTDDSFTSIELAQWINPFPINARQGNWSPLSDMKFDIWVDTYKLVRSAYIFMENIKPLPDQALSADQANSMKMEARFLIAYAYSRMLALYGPFPLVTELVSSDASTLDLMRPRTPYDEILDYLDKELWELSEFFPEKLEEESTQFGRPTKGICLAVRARMLLYAASPLFNGNPDYADVKNPDGTSIFPQSFDPNKWKRAADACREVLKLADKGVYSLYTVKNNDGTIDPFLSFQNLFLTTGETNKEIIFARPSSDYQGFVKARFPRGAGGNGYVAATQNLVDEFYMRNGLSIDDPGSGYVEDGFTTEPIYYDNTSYDQADPARTPGLVVSEGIYNMYANREPRFYVTIRYNNEYIPTEKRYTQYMNGGMDGRPTHDSPQCGIQPRKYASPEDRPRENIFSYRPLILLRLAEFYLSYAEALNECNPGNADILNYLNLVRERAGIPGFDESLLEDQKKTREAIRRERRIELAFENDVRYNDIRRWKIVEEVYGDEPTWGMNPWGENAETFYKRTKIMDNIFEKKMYLWPIIQDNMDNNPNLVQNKFW